jgi:NADH-quinone oxidoreductase subunit L
MEHPGLLYVAATLLPLAAFLLLLLAGGLRAALRSALGPSGPDLSQFSETDSWLDFSLRSVREKSGFGAWLYRLLGGDRPTPVGAYVATAAIAGAFVLSLIGFILHAQDTAHHDQPAAAHNHAHDHGAGEAGHKNGEKPPTHDRWADQVDWALLSYSSDGGQRPAITLRLGYRIDTLAATMFVMVTFISTLIFIFSIGYMGEELQPIVEDHQVHTEQGHLRRRGRFGRFFLFLSLFCFSMLNLVLADNLFQVFLSWELVGICSYLLIGFYYERSSASNAANKAFITNRIGDAGFIIGLLILWTYVGTLNFEELFARVRAPLRDSHDTPLVLAGRIVRAQEVGRYFDKDQEAGGRLLHVAPEGGEQVVLLPGHVHAAEVAPFEEAKVKKNAPAEETPGEIQVPDQGGPRDFATMPYWLLVVAGLGIFLGCVGKSAQFPLHVWLPDAMEGPTPVSALIHAATMVAAGVYLVGRCFPLFTHEARLVIAYTGGITLFVAASIALVMTDIKKVLAYSTVSQLGYMMLALGVGGWVAGLFHLLTHAFFKALLFLGSGSVIYGCHHEQDMLKMGGLYPKMKTTALTMLMGVLAIAGTPFFSGWYSKDAILAHAYGFFMVHPAHVLLLLLPLVTAGITAFYMFRMWFLTFTGPPRDEHVHESAHESPWVMTVPLIILAVCSIVVSYGWPIWDPEASLLEHHLHHSQHHAVPAEFGHLVEMDGLWLGGPLAREAVKTERGWATAGHALIGNIALGLVFLAFLFAGLMYFYGVLNPADAKEQFPGVHRFLANKWYFDELYSAILVRPALAVAGWCRAFDTKCIDGFVDGLARFTVRVARWDGKFDLGVIDGLVNLIARVAYAVGGWLRTVQTGYLRSYVLFLVLAAIAIFALLSYFVALATAG